MKIVPLTQGQFAKVDDQDFEWLSRWKWHAHWNPRTRSFYAVRTDYGLGWKNKRTIQMHRLVLATKMDNRFNKCDHKNHDTLDNQRDNLRPATSSENCRNRRMQKNNTSGLKGASWHKRDLKWEANIRVNGKQIYLGSYASRELAHAAYCFAAKEMHGEFASTGCSA